jgi:anthranilate/para-aminobenzoate synthase component I
LFDHDLSHGARNTTRGRYGGWVNDSTPEGEFQETINKSKAMLKAVALAESFGKTP